MILRAILFSFCSSFFPNNWVKYPFLVTSKWDKWRYQCPQNIFKNKKHTHTIQKVEPIVTAHKKASNLIFELKYHPAIAVMIFFWRKNVELFCYKNCYITAQRKMYKNLAAASRRCRDIRTQRNKRIFHTKKEEQNLFYTFAFFAAYLTIDYVSTSALGMLEGCLSRVQL